jgi:hypothetical protein
VCEGAPKRGAGVNAARMTDARFVSINELADRTGLPAAWLKREAEEARIPSTKVGRRRFFDTAAVLKALADRPDAGKAVARD